MKTLLYPLITLSLLSCGKQTPTKRVYLNQRGDVSLVMLGVENQEDVKLKAKELNLEVSGSEILVIKGDAEKIEELNFAASTDFDYIVDEALGVEKPVPFTPDQLGLYQAKKDFGLLEFWKKNPSADGRGVKVGVIDDGISPHQIGFITTSTGERKFLKKGSQSTFTTFDLTPVEGGLEATIDENREAYEGSLDLNADSVKDVWKVFIPAGSEKACIDLNKNQSFESEECKGSFSSTGEFFKARDPRLVLMMELDLTKNKVQIFQPEKGSDSHGEGVAAVLAGHRIGNIPGFDGVAPGAQILDYDLSEVTDKAQEKEYSLSTFLTSIDWMGSHGAEVANVSYSLFFTSTKTQIFMSKALDKLIKKYNMVISFSAGNNGPGLGSLNRLGIYPSSALVAGAYISKELDERVHGNTGLPDEGRVVYYSSRGPGLGVGPLLISPLSSLVNSSPDGGHRAFSGTSSASPALAGAATVLISAIKQENLKVDAATVVHALRLSGKRLKAEPFIFQGFGLPQVDKALEIYRELLRGERFMDVKVSLDRDAQDGVAPRGVFLQSSKVSGITTRKISLTGSLSEISPEEQKVNLLTPVKFIYPKGVRGARELWVSSSASNFSIDINPDEILDGKLEAFAEIKVISSIDNSLLTIVPVTVVNDQSVLNRPKTTLRLNTHEGVRFPLEVTPGVKGFKVSARVLDGDERGAMLSIFDPNGIRTIQQRLASDLWVSTPISGFYQVGLAMTGGTTRELVVEVTVEAISMTLRTRSALAKEASIAVTNSGSPTSGILTLAQVSTVVGAQLLGSKDISKGLEISQDLTQGTYTIEVRATRGADLSYVYSTCNIREESPDGKVKLKTGFTISAPAEGLKVSVRCMPFDLGAEFEEAQEWEMRLLKNGVPQPQRLDIQRDQTKSTTFKDLTPGAYEVKITDPFSQNSIELGTVDLY